MSFFLLFLLTCFFGGFLLPNVRLSRLSVLLAGLCVVIMTGYYFVYRLI